MSYILEALKKSQQERELGRVPSLRSSPLFEERPAPHPTHHWALLATGLAALAVVIALYAAFRGPAPVQGPRPADHPAGAQALPQTMVSTGPPVPTVPPSPPTTPQPLIEPPPPKPRPLASEPQTGAQPRASTPPPQLEGDWEAAILRQIEAEQAALNAAREVLQDPVRSSIPEDLIQEIESFKEQVRHEQRGQTPPNRARREPAKIPEDPTQLRLTPEQQAEIPAFLMTVHVYDPDPAQRFVIINALRYREGDETREGLKVEKILKEGAVLSYRGTPFYVAR